MVKGNFPTPVRYLIESRIKQRLQRIQATIVDLYVDFTTLSDQINNLLAR